MRYTDDDYPIGVFRSALASLAGTIFLHLASASAGVWLGPTIRFREFSNPLGAPLYVLFSPVLALFAPWLFLAIFVLSGAYFVASSYESSRVRGWCCVATFAVWASCVLASAR